MSDHLNETPDWFAVCGYNVLLIGMDDFISLGPGQVVLWQMEVDLVTIKVGVESVAVGIVHANDPFTLHVQPHC